MNFVDLGWKDPSATEKVVFDFLSNLAVGETISSATVTATVWTGSDSAPSGLVNGAATIAGSQVTQSLHAGNDGTIYKLICTAVTSGSQTLVLNGYLAVGGNPL